MNRIDRIFKDLRGNGTKALMPFLTGGDPDLKTTGLLLAAMERAGASICELGIPFSDPIADGPVIQDSMMRALERGIRPGQVFEMVASVRSRLRMGLIAMVSYSIVYRLGPKPFIRDAAEAGIDGFIFPDLPVNEFPSARDAVAREGLVCSMLIAPSTPTRRAERIVEAASGFVYLLARAGIMGERKTLPPDLPRQIERLRQVTDLPIAVGFGISQPEHVRRVVRLADAAIVGSAIVRRVAEQPEGAGPHLIDEVEQFVRGLAEGLTPDEGRVGDD